DHSPASFLDFQNIFSQWSRSAKLTSSVFIFYGIVFHYETTNSRISPTLKVLFLLRSIFLSHSFLNFQDIFFRNVSNFTNKFYRRTFTNHIFDHHILFFFSSFLQAFIPPPICQTYKLCFHFFWYCI